MTRGSVDNDRSGWDDYPLVIIDWIDAVGYSESGWLDVNGLEPEVRHCVSAGWLIRDDENMKVVVPHFAGTSIDGAIAIPTSCVKRINRIGDRLAKHEKRARKLGEKP